MSKTKNILMTTLVLSTLSGNLILSTATIKADGISWDNGIAVNDDQLSNITGYDVHDKPSSSGAQAPAQSTAPEQQAPAQSTAPAYTAPAAQAPAQTTPQYTAPAASTPVPSTNNNTDTGNNNATSATATGNNTAGSTATSSSAQASSVASSSATSLSPKASSAVKSNASQIASSAAKAVDEVATVAKSLASASDSKTAQKNLTEIVNKANDTMAASKEVLASNDANDQQKTTATAQVVEVAKVSTAVTAVKGVKTDTKVKSEENLSTALSTAKDVVSSSNNDDVKNAKNDTQSDVVEKFKNAVRVAGIASVAGTSDEKKQAEQVLNDAKAINQDLTTETVTVAKSDAQKTVEKIQNAQKAEEKQDVKASTESKSSVAPILVTVGGLVAAAVAYVTRTKWLRLLKR
jgi:hypothetical protein